MKKTIGGDRLGSGKKMETDLHNYGRSTHNLSRTWRSTMAPGVLIPFLCEVGLNGDTWDIDLNAVMRTIPTVGPLFGSFKLQLDIFKADMRLYQGVLHNNPINIGMNMDKVLFPQIEITTMSDKRNNGNTPYSLSQISSNALMKYLGVSGLGRNANEAVQDDLVTRRFNACPVLMYYDVFKNYYANKQESKAYVIMPGDIETNEATINKIIVETPFDYEEKGSGDVFNVDQITSVKIFGNHLTLDTVEMEDDESGDSYQLRRLVNEGKIRYERATITDTYIRIFPTSTFEWSAVMLGVTNLKTTNANLTLKDFDLENIDKMRRELLKINDINERYVIKDDENAFYPYKALVQKTATTNWSYNRFSQNGLLVKTYQSDLFNNWINTDWIEGENGIAAVTAVSTAQGDKFTMDALNLAQKIYAMLNRVAVSGGTWQDWQEAVYGEEAIRHAETPIYCGGMSSEIVFEEVVQTATSESEKGELGSLGGKGTLNGRKGGHVEIKVNEPCIIMGIVSITPRVDYTQGNKWYMTELDNVNDLHKPALDAVGFQDLMCEQMAWWDTVIAPGTSTITYRGAAGKVPAWINYMTAYDEAFGDFANEDNSMFMILARNYEKAENGGIGDLTTYIDPTKYNYAFAYNKLDAQNFWAQIRTEITARRKMSAKVIPNL